MSECYCKTLNVLPRNRKKCQRIVPDSVGMPAKADWRDLYNIYIAIFNSGISPDKKIQLMTPLFAWEAWSWRVVGISVKAMKKYEANDFNKLSKQLDRDHFGDGRKHTFKQMFYLKDDVLMKNPMGSLNKWWKLFWNNDETIIVTKDEHKQTHGEIKYYPLNWEDGYFPCDSLIGFRYQHKIEKCYLCKLHVEGLPDKESYTK